MNTLSILARYGSFEVKQAYRKNLTIGMITAGLLFLAAATTTSIIAKVKAESSPIIWNPAPPDTIQLWNTPQIVEQYPVVDNSIQQKVKLSVGEIKPVADSLADDNVDLPTQDQLADMVARLHIKNIDDIVDNQIIIANPGELLPAPDSFIPRDEEPQVIESVEPVYPPMAMQAGITGKVWVNVLIDKEGKVRDAKIIKDSGAYAGFEEAALEAARKTTWKPALSNGQPVAVWLGYSISFVLR